jgi:hypothetical protein
VKNKLFLFKLRVTTGDAELILTLNNYYETCYNWKVLLILPMLVKKNIHSADFE